MLPHALREDCVDSLNNLSHALLPKVSHRGARVVRFDELHDSKAVAVVGERSEHCWKAFEPYFLHALVRAEDQKTPKTQAVQCSTIENGVRRKHSMGIELHSLTAEWCGKVEGSLRFQQGRKMRKSMFIATSVDRVAVAPEAEVLDRMQAG